MTPHVVHEIVAEIFVHETVLEINIKYSDEMGDVALSYRQPIICIL